MSSNTEGSENSGNSPARNFRRGGRNQANGRNDAKRKNNNNRNNNNRNNNTNNGNSNGNSNNNDNNNDPNVKNGIFHPEEEAIEGITTEDCPICANPIKYIAKYSCNHTTCHKCALRLRALMNNKQCPQCRTDRDTVIITTDAKRPFEYLNHPQRILEEETKFGLRFNNETVYKDTINLLKFNCPYKDCTYVASGWKPLRDHAMNEHHLLFCSYCIEHKKLFTNEFDLYTRSGLRNHEQKVTSDENGFKGHPLCAYCNSRFYSQDELIPHLKLKHEECFICTRQRPDLPHFFRNYDALETHFEKEHYVCNVRSCLEKKFVVFATPLELQVHQKTEHPDQFGGRKLDLNLSFDTGRNKNHNHNNNNNNRHRSNLSTISSSNMGASSSSPAPNNSVQISHGEAFPVLGVNPQHSSSSSSLSTAAASSSSSTQPASASSNWTITPEMAELADRRLRERVRIALQEDPLKFAQFDQTNEEFLAGEKSAYDLLDEYRMLFPNMSVEELEGVVVGFTKVILRNPIKVKEINRAWEEYRARIQPPSAISASSRSGSSSSLSASKMRGSGVWGTTAVSRKGVKAANALAQGDTSAFPSLPSASNSDRRAFTNVAPRISPSPSSNYISSFNVPRRNIPGAGPAYNVYGGGSSSSATKSYASVSGPMIVGTNRSTTKSSTNSNSSSSTSLTGASALGSASWAAADGKGKKAKSTSTSNNNSNSSIDTSSFPALPASAKKRSTAPLTNPLAGSRVISSDSELAHATNLLRESRLSNDTFGSNGSSSANNANGSGSKKGKKKKEVLFSYGV